MNKIIGVILPILLAMLPTFVKADLNDEALQYAISAFGLNNSVACNDGKNKWAQWKLVARANQNQGFRPGFTQPLQIPQAADSDYYIETKGDFGYQMQLIPLSEADRMNGFSWNGILTWNADAHRSNSTDNRQRPIWTSTNPVFRMQLQQIRGQWVILDMEPNGTAVQYSGCVNLDAATDNADQQHNEQTQRILDEQRRQYQNNLLKYPTPLHKPDPYYRPNPIQN